MEQVTSTTPMRVRHGTGIGGAVHEPAEHSAAPPRGRLISCAKGPNAGTPATAAAARYANKPRDVGLS